MSPVCSDIMVFWPHQIYRIHVNGKGNHFVANTMNRAGGKSPRTHSPIGPSSKACPELVWNERPLRWDNSKARVLPWAPELPWWDWTQLPTVRTFLQPWPRSQARPTPRLPSPTRKEQEGPRGNSHRPQVTPHDEHTHLSAIVSAWGSPRSKP